MDLRYAGAVKDYLYLPLLAAFGPNMIVLRLGSMLLGALGIWGLGRLIGEHVSPLAGGIVALILAVNPSYLNMMAFDYGGFPVWMGAFGMLCWAVGRYPRTNTPSAAFWIGVACGFGVWARANFVWLLAAVFVAALIVRGRRILAPVLHWVALIVGGIAGGALFLIYEVHSKGGRRRPFVSVSERPSFLFPAGYFGAPLSRPFSFGRCGCCAGIDDYSGEVAVDRPVAAVRRLGVLLADPGGQGAVDDRWYRIMVRFDLHAGRVSRREVPGSGSEDSGLGAAEQSLCSDGRQAAHS